DGEQPGHGRDRQRRGDQPIGAPRVELRQRQLHLRASAASANWRDCGAADVISKRTAATCPARADVSIRRTTQPSSLAVVNDAASAPPTNTRRSTVPAAALRIQTFDSPVATTSVRPRGTSGYSTTVVACDAGGASS